MGSKHGKLRQGLHVDPRDQQTATLDPSTWSTRRKEAFASESMAEYRRSLCLDAKKGVREAVLDDLSSYYCLTPDECVRRCVHWEEWSVEEWAAAPRDSTEGLRDFYTSTQSWSFDLMWYAYLQAEGYAYPVNAAIGESVGKGGARRHLDFGSGVGVTSQLFLRLGYESDLADVSTTLLAFARYRLGRRGEPTGFIDLNQETLQPDRYDVITAIDTLVHVPSLPETVALLHRALKPGGLLFANFDARPPTPENAWHLYSDDLPLRWRLHRAGFEPEEKIDGFVTKYRRVEPVGVPHALRGLRDAVSLRSPLRPAYRRLRELRSLAGKHS